MTQGEARPLPAARQPYSAAHRCLSLHPGEPCGDAAQALPIPGGVLLVLLDGLGHGAPAALAADRALSVLRDRPGDALPELVDRLDAALRDTRGAAIGLVRLGPGQMLTAAGVGNISMMHGQGKRLLCLPSQPGYLGGRSPARLLEQQRPLHTGDCVVLHTDGVAGPLAVWPWLPEWHRSPQLLCEQVLARHRRSGDDAGVLACHWQPDPPGSPSC